MDMLVPGTFNVAVLHLSASLHLPLIHVQSNKNIDPKVPKQAEAKVV